jgi:hypothetical protein
MYPKKLRSLDDLKREKRELKNKLNKLKSAGTHPAEESKTDSGSNILSMLTGLLAPGIISEMVLKTVFSVISSAGKKAKKKTVNPLLKEFAGGYLKWKMLELGYRWLRRYLNKKNEVKQEMKSKAEAN